MTFAERKAEHRRRLVVQLLGEDSREPCNLHLLADALADLGQDVPIDEMAGIAEWLAEAGLLRFVERTPPTTVLLTARGRRLAGGRILVSGVADPLP
ncbi:MAG: hypothetical protein OXN81_03355 [Alphaproteobacteria bacterium]|nr:hypothetical protein [Alphaproteobacteria bacterium]